MDNREPLGPRDHRVNGDHRDPLVDLEAMAREDRGGLQAHGERLENKVGNLCPFLSFARPCKMTKLTYTLTLHNL